MAHEHLEVLIARYETRLEKLRAIQALLADDPTLLNELREALFPPAEAEPTKYEQVARFLASKNNEWQSARDIAHGTGLLRNTVNFLLFTSKHKDEFESQMRGPKKKVWRLKQGHDLGALASGNIPRRQPEEGEM
jgi:hypothetical protein